MDPLDFLALIPAALFTLGPLVHRTIQGKPIWFFGVADADYQERRASGHSNGFLSQVFGFARNCLVVAIAHDRLIVRPWFPFTLFFLFDVYGLECDVPVRSITRVHEYTAYFRSALDIEFVDEAGHAREFSLFLENPEPLREAARRAGARIE